MKIEKKERRERKNGEEKEGEKREKIEGTWYNGHNVNNDEQYLNLKLRRVHKDPSFWGKWASNCARWTYEANEKKLLMKGWTKWVRDKHTHKHKSNGIINVYILVCSYVCLLVCIYACLSIGIFIIIKLAERNMFIYLCLSMCAYLC